jgi:uncharacterized cofD-like protein
MAIKNKKVVVIGGGTGVYTVLSGLKRYPLDLAAVVSMADDGGSTGKLREEFGILPPGDVRRALVALSNADKHLSDLFNFRFDEGVLRGHNFGNLFITALERMEGDFQKAVNLAGKILGARGKVVPVTLDNVKLVARMENGEMVYGETNIDIPKHNGRLQIKEIFLKPSAKINPYAIDVLKSADVIIIGPGDLFTSLIPNLLVKGVKKAISSSKAKKIYIVNLMTKFGETNKFKASDFLSVLEKYLGKNVINSVIMNIEKPSLERLKKYAEEHAEIVRPDIHPSKKLKVIKAELLRDKGFLRHDPDKLAKVIFQEI